MTELWNSQYMHFISVSFTAIEPRHLFQCQGTFVGHKVLFYVFSHTVTSFPGPFEKSDIADTLFGPKCAYVCSCTIKTPEV